MTHDELLARLKEKGNYDLALLKYNLNGIRDIQTIYNALRAVVQLHKPELNENGKQMFCIYCSSFSYRYVEYPCPEIQAIEKELK